MPSLAHLERTHVARQNKPAITVRNVEQPGHMHDGYMKPHGFWYEVDGDWRRWCESESPQWIKNTTLYRVELRDEDMLNIRTPAQLRAFHEAYKWPLMPGLSRLSDHIAWWRVAEKYDGIEIAPYLWSMRLGFRIWYYGWDCASGCVWRPKGMTVTRIGPTARAAERKSDAS